MSVRRHFGLAAALCASWLIACSAAAPEVEARHVVLVSLDALGAKHVGSYGHDADTTPELDQIAAEGTLFESAYTQQLWTLTSHLTMMTGLSPQAHGAGYQQPARPGIVTLAQHLKHRGFATGAFVGAQGFMKPRYGLGRGFDTYVTRNANTPLDNSEAFRWLREQAKLAGEDPGHRIFLFLHYYDVHSDAGTDVPYDSPDRRRFMPDGLRWNHRGDTAALGRLRRSGKVTDDDRAALHALYDAGVYFVDAEAVGAIARTLNETGLADDTLLVITSDHGDELFEHGSISHQQPYDEGARVPLVMRGPGVPAGKRVDGLAGLVDLLPTLLARLGFDPPDDIEGRDLSPLLRDEGRVRDAVFVDGMMTGYRHYRSAAVVDDGDERHAWVGQVVAEPGEAPRRFRHAPTAELYDLRADPDQRHDLRAAAPERAADAERRVLAWYAEVERRSRGLGDTVPAPVLTDDERERLRALGYGE